VGDTGSAARFFYTAKADAEDRLGSKHPTVKPLDLMQWLVRLVTPKGGTVLDPFAGTGTTGEAAWREGCRAILIEREDEYQADIARRMELATQPTKRAAVAASKNKLERAEDLPLFNMLGEKAG
jgi:DNA modification methylase